jgi:hypothetical protein
VACVALFVLGIIKAKSASPARIVAVLYELSLTDAKESSMKRTIRRVENDPQVNATVCLHRFARERLFAGYLKELILILDPTAQEDGVVMVEVALRYRKRTCQLPELYCRAMFRLEKTAFGYVLNLFLIWFKRSFPMKFLLLCLQIELLELLLLRICPPEGLGTMSYMFKTLLTPEK